MIGVINYFQPPPTDYRRTYNPGQLYWAPVPYVLTPRPKRLQLGDHVPNDPSQTTFLLRDTDLATFRPEDDPPLRVINLGQDEFLLASAHKKRMVILVSDRLAEEEESGAPVECRLVVPCYGLQDRAGNYKGWATPAFIRKLQGYQYPGLFYLPADDAGGVEESVVRIDRMTAVPEAHLQPRPPMLTSDATSLLREWIYHFLGAPLFNNTLEEYIRRAAAATGRPSE